jgi:hypothetical protein
MIHWLHQWKRRPMTALELLGQAVDVRSLGGVKGAKEWVESRKRGSPSRRRKR